jgi:hypothetical protein
VRAILLLVALLSTVAALADQPGTVYTVATSHLDTQWRWTIQTTIDEYLLRIGIIGAWRPHPTYQPPISLPA